MLIAKTGYAHTVGEELLIPVVSEVLETVLHRPSADVVKKIPLSNNTVQRRIDETANNVEDALCSSLRTTQFSLQIDESCLSGNEVLLLAYVRFIKDEKLVQELLFAKELVTDTKGASIFALLKAYFAEKKIPLANIVSVPTDGAPSMSGIYRAFIAFLKQEVPDSLGPPQRYPTAVIQRLMPRKAYTPLDTDILLSCLAVPARSEPPVCSLSRDSDVKSYLPSPQKPPGKWCHASKGQEIVVQNGGKELF
uniref:DUF4371 domain-containing protein n=1 Tax=Trichuris muris TaxID=70415 RepID=A0A5S6QNG0_TRIMR